LPISNYLVVAIAGALGVSARYLVSHFVVMRLGPQFPWSTLIVNLTGSFLLGLATVYGSRDQRGRQRDGWTGRCLSGR